jgi:transcriptional regulator with XRE-family HTH domain
MSFEVGSPNPIDVHVGNRLRMRRKALAISQSELASALNLTFQQVQKYERGTNRVSVSKLYAAALALRIPVAYFFEGYCAGAESPGFEESRSEQLVNAFLMSSEGIELAEAFPRIRAAKHRRKILDLVRSMADEV